MIFNHKFDKTDHTRQICYFVLDHHVELGKMSICNKFHKNRTQTLANMEGGT